MTHPIFNPLMSCIDRLHLDERGTTITEFVVVLPVFVLIFSATLALSKMQHIGIETQIRASSEMWTNAITIQTDTAPIPDTTHMSAQQGGLDAANMIGARAKPSTAHSVMTARWQAAQQKGHMGEAMAMVSPIESYMPTSFGLDAYSKLHSAHSRYGETEMRLADSVGDIFDPNSKKAAFNLLNDSSSMNPLPISSIQQASNMSGLYPLLDSTTPEGAIYSDATSQIGSSRIAIATGLRYGIAQGKSELDVIHPLFPSTPQLSAGFDTLIAPKAQESAADRARTNYISHMTLMNETIYSTLLSIDYDETFEYDTSY